MVDPHLLKLWALIEADLRRARDLLPPAVEDQQSLAQYYEFLEHNELGLACDALEESAKDRIVGTEFWLALRDAATKMQLPEHATRYEDRAKML